MERAMASARKAQSQGLTSSSGFGNFSKRLETMVVMEGRRP